MSKVMPNEPCPCGSGLKYKKCCRLTPFKYWKSNAVKVLSDVEHGDIIKKVYFATLELLHEQRWLGACHASSAIMYLLLKGLGVSPILCVGEVKSEYGIFDHSWIEIENKVFDVAISLPLNQDMPNTPVMNSLHIDTLNEISEVYGLSDPDFDAETQLPLLNSVGEYMSKAPCDGGLWTRLAIVAETAGFDINIKMIQEKYGNDRWIIYASNPK